MKRKRDLDMLVAADLGVTLQDISLVTDMFLRHTRAAIVEEGIVHLDGFGKFRLSEQPNSKLTLKKKGGEGITTVEAPPKLRVHFSKAPVFRRQLRESRTMEKYGVNETIDQDLEKRAAQGCPKCGTKPSRHGAVLVCRNCGTEPFESPPPRINEEKENN